MVNKLHIWDSVSTSQKRNHTTITVYVLGRTGRSLLRMLHCFARDSQSFSINNHNMQATETLIQALYASYFKHMLENHIYLAPAQFEAMFLSAAHTREELVGVLDVMRGFFLKDN